MPILLSHLTSLKVAVEITISGYFKPAYENELGDDSGMNCFEEGIEYDFNHITSREATLVCEWSGPLKILPPRSRPPFEPNVLVRQEPHRSLVTFGTTQGLKIKRIDSDQANWVSLFEKTPWHKLTESAKDSWKERQVSLLKQKLIDKILLGQFVRVGV